MTPEARIEQWFREVLQELRPRLLVSRALRAEAGEFADVAAESGANPRCGIAIAERGEVLIVAIGKAAIAMAEGTQDALGGRFRRGLVLTVDGPDASSLDARWTVFRAGHPIPDQRAIDATRTILEAVEGLNSDDTVLALISGGGSALFELPRAPLMLADFAVLTRQLLNAGAPIQHLNMVRIPLSEVKGGSFRQRSPAGIFITLILSDVLGNNPQIIASGPTVAPGSDSAAALQILDRYRLRDIVSPAVLAVLHQAAGEEVEWDHPSDYVEIVGDVALAIRIASDLSCQAGYETRVLEGMLEGEASGLAREFVGQLLETGPGIDAVWSGGEATVTVRGDGLGGRNTEFALAAALELDRLENDDWVVASLATDGQDATTGSAGAIASRETIARARSMGLDPENALASNDSATFFRLAGGLVITGPSGTNVNDLYAGLRRHPSGK